jgi:hypothetical protein
MKKTKCLTGLRFGRLIVGEFSHKRKYLQYWSCICDCGGNTIAYAGNLKNGNTQSCGCFHSERFKHVTHGQSETWAYGIWGKMKDRCLNPNNQKYKDYGGRGIKIHERWLNSFENFSSDMGPRPSPKHSIDRKDNDGDYAPDNCHWVTSKEQTRNKRTNVIIDMPQGQMCLLDAARLAGIEYGTLYKRIVLRNWPKDRWFDPPGSRLRRKLA